MDNAFIIILATTIQLPKKRKKLHYYQSTKNKPNKIVINLLVAPTKNIEISRPKFLNFFFKSMNLIRVAKPKRSSTIINVFSPSYNISMETLSCLISYSKQGTYIYPVTFFTTYVCYRLVGPTFKYVSEF